MTAREKSHGKMLPILVLFLLVGSLAGCITTPPFQEMSDARQAISAAEDAGAAEKSPRLYAMATSHLQKAKAYIASHNFTLARSNAVLARQRAVEALREIQQAGF